MNVPERPINPPEYDACEDCGQPINSGARVCKGCRDDYLADAFDDDKW